MKNFKTKKSMQSGEKEREVNIMRRLTQEEKQRRKQADYIYYDNLYIRNGYKGIYDFYKNPSYYKVAAWNELKYKYAAGKEFSKGKSLGICVTGGNCQFFRAVCSYVSNKTGAIEYLCFTVMDVYSTED